MKNPIISTAILLTGFVFQSQAHEMGFSHDHHVPPVENQNHDAMESGVKLEFDPIFCDLNENFQVDEEEMTPDNLCYLEGSEDLFSQKPIASLGLRKGELVLTIDDGPNPQVTKPILDLLDQYGIKATFFVVGSLVPRNAGLIREMIQRGHTIGNHTYSHNVKAITSETITSEILKAHEALKSALGHEPQGRLLFRAPGLGWNSMKAINLNANSVTRRYIGPIHANLGTDAPRADWACWASATSAETCANYYFQDIVSTGRGIVLSHDIFYRSGRGNTYEMLKILLHRLHNQAGGIINRNIKDGGGEVGVWRFVTMQKNSVLDQFEVSGADSSTSVPISPSKPDDQGTSNASTLGGNELSIRNESVYVRATNLKEENAISDSSKIMIDGKPAISGMLVSVVDLQGDLIIGGATFKLVRVQKAQDAFKSLEGKTVYISTKAF